MYQHTRLTNNNFNFFQKFKNFDYILFICILLLGFYKSCHNVFYRWWKSFISYKKSFYKISCIYNYDVVYFIYKY